MPHATAPLSLMLCAQGNWVLDLEVKLIDEPYYSVNSTDNVRTYDAEYCRDNKYQHSCAHGIALVEGECLKASVVLIGVGGRTAAHESSLVRVGSTCFVACGDSVFALNFPSLELLWVRRVDFATCFGVYWCENFDSLITWGELNVCRLDSRGNELWSVAGTDILTESFEIKGGHIWVTDYVGDKLRISIESGSSEQLST